MMLIATVQVAATLQFNVSYGGDDTVKRCDELISRDCIRHRLSIVNAITELCLIFHRQFVAGAAVGSFSDYDILGRCNRQTVNDMKVF
jgi:hypothetical protein